MKTMKIHRFIVSPFPVFVSKELGGTLPDPDCVPHAPVQRTLSWNHGDKPPFCKPPRFYQKRKISPKRKLLAGFPCGHPAKNFSQALQILAKASILARTCRADVHERTSVSKIVGLTFRSYFRGCWDMFHDWCKIARRTRHQQHCAMSSSIPNGCNSSALQSLIWHQVMLFRPRHARWSHEISIQKRWVVMSLMPPSLKRAPPCKDNSTLIRLPLPQCFWPHGRKLRPWSEKNSDQNPDHARLWIYQGKEKLRPWSEFGVLFG